MGIGALLLIGAATVGPVSHPQEITWMDTQMTSRR
jgi:hypothetical protein